MGIFDWLFGMFEIGKKQTPEMAMSTKREAEIVLNYQKERDRLRKEGNDPVVAEKKIHDLTQRHNFELAEAQESTHKIREAQEEQKKALEAQKKQAELKPAEAHK